jgi:hypothetical protein
MENNTTSTLTPDQEFDALMEKYKEAARTLASNPGDHKEGYNPDAHKYSMKARAGMDLCLAKLIIVKQSEVHFTSVDFDQGVYAINYNAFGTEFDNDESIELDVIEAPIYKMKGFKMYEDENMGKIKWLITVMIGNVGNLFASKLLEDIESGFYKNKMKEFARKVSDVMRNYPHKEMESYSDWMTAFVVWLSSIESDCMVVVDIADAVLKSLEYVFYAKDRKKYEKDGVLEQKVNESSSIPSWETCSKESHKRFLEINFKVKRNLSFMEKFRARANAQREEKKAALEKAKGAQKRKLPDAQAEATDENSEPALKKQKPSPPEKADEKDSE